MGSLFKIVLSWLTVLAFQAAANATSMRLPDVVAPLSYRLTLTIDPEQDRHSGEVAIAIDIKRASRLIRLHGSGRAMKEIVGKWVGR